MDFSDVTATTAAGGVHGEHDQLAFEARFKEAMESGLVQVRRREACAMAHVAFRGFVAAVARDDGVGCWSTHLVRFLCPSSSFLLSTAEHEAIRCVSHQLTTRTKQASQSSLSSAHDQDLSFFVGKTQRAKNKTKKQN